MEALKDPFWKVRKNAAESLAVFSDGGGQAVEQLRERLTDENVEVRRAAILALGRLAKGNPKIMEELTKFTGDSDPLTGINTVIALAEMGKTDDGTIPVLLEALGNKDKATAKAASHVLGNMGKTKPDQILPTMMQALEKNQEPLVGYAIQVLRRMKQSAAPALARMAALYDSADPGTKLDIVDAVVTIDKNGDHAIPLLVKGLKSTDPLDRKDALLGLTKYRDKPELYLDAVAGVLKDSDPDIRVQAVQVLKGYGNKSIKAVPALIALIDDPEIRVRRSAIGTMGWFKPPPGEALPALEKAMKDKDRQVRIAAADALALFGQTYPEQVTQVLQQALASETDERVKEKIASVAERVSSGLTEARAQGERKPPVGPDR